MLFLSSKREKWKNALLHLYDSTSFIRSMLFLSSKREKWKNALLHLYDSTTAKDINFEIDVSCPPFSDLGQFFLDDAIHDLLHSVKVLPTELYLVGVKDRSITQPRVILKTLSPPLNGGVFGASEPYTSVR